MKTRSKAIYLSGVVALLAVATASAETTGNRYGYPVLYHSDISAARAWVDIDSRKRVALSNGRKLKPVIVDVRRVEEFVKGHPPGAISIPFPHVSGSPKQANDNTNGYIGYDISVDSEVGFLAAEGKDGALPISDFVNYVSSLYPDKDTPIYLLCATGHRSVQAANALAKYGSFTQVRNIWEGYNGQPKYAYTGALPTNKIVDGKAQFVQLDLNNDGKFDDNDKDGWAYYQGLPTTNKLVRKDLARPFFDLYAQFEQSVQAKTGSPSK